MPMESWTLGFLFFIRQCRNSVAKYFVEWRVPGLTEICTNQRPKMPRKVVDILKLFFVFFFYVQKLVTGLTVRDNDQIYEVLA